jgi:hypothetical protein
MLLHGGLLFEELVGATLSRPPDGVNRAAPCNVGERFLDDPTTVRG